MPTTDRTYGTVIYATGVVDFTEDEEAIKAMLREGIRTGRESFLSSGSSPSKPRVSGAG
jgi:hypothetical protein